MKNLLKIEFILIIMVIMVLVLETIESPSMAWVIFFPMILAIAIAIIHRINKEKR